MPGGTSQQADSQLANDNNNREVIELRNIMNRAYVWAQDLKYRARDEEAQGVVEYALIIGFVSIAIIATLATAGDAWITALSGKITTKIATIT